MATKWYNRQSFHASVDGRNYSFYAHTTRTRNGFCHTIQTLAEGTWLTDTKVSYFNRTWERFDYETALEKAIDKCPKEDREELREIVIERKSKEEEERCESFFNMFKSEYDKLSDKNKEIMANTPLLVSEEDAKSALNVMRMMNAVDLLNKK